MNLIDLLTKNSHNNHLNKINNIKFWQTSLIWGWTESRFLINCAVSSWRVDHIPWDCLFLFDSYSQWMING